MLLSWMRRDDNSALTWLSEASTTGAQEGKEVHQITEE